jgi:hypothetical protein
MSFTISVLLAGSHYSQLISIQTEQFPSSFSRSFKKALSLPLSMHEWIANALRVSCPYFNLYKDTPRLTSLKWILKYLGGYQIHPLKVLAL